MMKRIPAGALILLTMTAGLLYHIFTPQHASQLNYEGQIIKIERDQHSIPHIYSRDRRSYLYALGYVMAEDRLFQCTIKRIIAQGRLSQYLGEASLPVDINMRDLSLHLTGKQIALKMKEESPQIYDDFDAFSQGINEGTANRKAYPIQFYILGIKWEQWTVSDTLTLHKMLEWSLSHNLLDEYTRSSLLGNYTVEEIGKMFPVLQQNWAFNDTTTVKDHDLPPRLVNHKYFQNSSFEALQISKLIGMSSPEVYFEGGSNAWAVSGQHTQSGKPLLGADSHLDAIIPSHWYQFRSTYTHEGKQINFVGVALPGVPTPNGKNQYWGIFPTVLVSDTIDGFKEKIEGNRYLIDGQWRELQTRTELIKIKQGKELRIVNHTVRFTHRGPVLNYIIGSIGMYDLREEPISISWTGHNLEYMSFVKCNRNNEILNFEELRERLQKETSYYLSLSTIFATDDGHIGYAQMGVNPRRPQNRLGSYISDGTSTKNDWLGTLPYSDRLVIFDPKDGFLVTSNNRPASSEFIGGYFDTTVFTARATRLEELIQNQIDSGRKITNEFARSTIFDTVDIYCRAILPDLLMSLPEADKLLKNFTCDFKSNSYQATIYELFFFELWKVTKPLPENNISYISLHSPFQSLYHHVHKAANGSQNHREKMFEAWKRMMIRLQTFFKTRDIRQWQWGLFHRDVSKHTPLGSHQLFSKLYNRESPGWGNLHTVNLGRAAKLEEGNFATIQRANLRNVFDFGGPSWWIIDTGVSENLLSKHYDDQWKLFISEQFLPLYPDKRHPQQNQQINQSGL